MDQAANVMVFNFRVFDTEVRGMSPSKFKAPRHVVERLGGVVLEGTSEYVSLDALDEHGRYQRIATGWGAS